jgi:hypothetical protein
MNTKGLKYTIIVIFSILSISFLADKITYLALNKISDNVFTGQSIGKLNHYLQIKNDVDFIIFGSSRANYHIDPSRLSYKSFNMGMDGRKIAYSATLIKLLPKKKTQFILLHIDPENAFSQDYTGSDIKVLNSKYNRINIIKEEIDKLEKNNLFQNYYWCLGYNSYVLGILKNYFKPKYDYRAYFGYDPIFVDRNQRKIFDNILSTDNNEVDCQNTFTLNNIYELYIEDLKVFCKENNKTLVIFTSPEFNDKCKEDNIRFTQVMKIKGIPYYDLTDFFKYNNNQEFWKDKNHLSNKGARMFTNEVKRIVDNNNYLPSSS